MCKRYILANCVALAAAAVIAGCQHKNVNMPAREPNLQNINLPSDYRGRAIEATGGPNAWTEATKLQFDAVVTFYQPDGSFYLTKQNYIIYPWLNSIEIFGKEPRNNFAWRLSQGRFEVLQGSGRISNAISVIDYQCYAEAILSIITAPVRFLDKSVEFTKDVNPLEIEGQWYYPIVRQTKADIESILRIPKAVFYQNRDNSIIEMIWIDCLSVDQFLMVRGYDYSKIKEGQIVVPRTIEIFLTDSRNSSHRRLVKIDIIG